MGLLGMRQVNLVVDGVTTALTPVDGTAEGWRLRLARIVARPAVIGALSWIMLVAAWVYELPQLIALIGGALGAGLEPPFSLPGAANFALGIRRARRRPRASPAVQEQPLARLSERPTGASRRSVRLAARRDAG